MNFRLMLLLLLSLGVIVSCSSPNRFQSDRSFSANEYDPGMDYSPGNNAIDDYDDDSFGDYNSETAELSRELTPEVKKRIDNLLVDYFSIDEDKKNSTAQRLIAMGATISDYLTSKINAQNKLEMLSLINEINSSDEDMNDASENNNSSGNENNNTNYPDENEEYKPDVTLNANTLEELESNGINVDEIQKFYKLNLQKLQLAYESNDFKKAQELAKAMLALFPKQENTVKYLKYLLGMIEDSLQSSSILQGKVSADKEIYEYGEKIQFRFLLRNVSSSVVKVVFSNDVSRARTEYSRYYSPCIIHLTFSQWSERSTLSNKESIPYSLEGKTELAPGEVWQHVWEYDPAKAKESEAIGAIKISADIRPLQVLINEERVGFKAIKLAAKEVKIYPSGYNEISNGENVIENLKEALKNAESVRMIIAATVAGKTEKTKWQATEILINALKTSRGEVRIGVFKSLRAIHGFDLAYDENFWREWYEHNKPK